MLPAVALALLSSVALASPLTRRDAEVDFTTQLCDIVRHLEVTPSLSIKAPRTFLVYCSLDAAKTDLKYNSACDADASTVDVYSGEYKGKLDVPWTTLCPADKSIPGTHQVCYALGLPSLFAPDACVPFYGQSTTISPP